MQKSQCGLGLLGLLIVIAIAVALGYYAYKGIWQADEGQPSCASALNACTKNCRRTQTESADMQRCQQACQREADACSTSGR
jgi:uncharacterized protein HemX